MLGKLLAALALALVCLPAPAALAQDEEPEAAGAAEEGEAEQEEEPVYDRDGWYAGIGGGIAFSEFDEGNADDSGLVNLRAGYHFLRFAALEVQLEYEPEFGSGSGNYAGVDTALWSAWLAAKGYPTAPWTGPVQPYLLGGIAWMWKRQTGPAVDGSEEDGAFAMRVGGGLDVYVTRNVVLTVDSSWVVPTGNLEDLWHVTLGGAVQYRF
jgi:opacity protein-like surface antigen